MSRSLVWFRRDLRVHDHPALDAARRATDEIVCLLVVEPALLAASRHRAAAYSAAAAGLTRELAARGASLTVRLGPAETAVPAAAAEARAQTVFVVGDVTPRAGRRDAAVASALEDSGVTLVSLEGMLARNSAIQTSSGAAYRVFTPFHRRWEGVAPGAPAPAPRVLRARRLRSDPAAATALAEAAGTMTLTADERGALRTLRRFVRERVPAYPRARSRLDGAGGSRLSTAIRVGALSARTALVASGARGRAWARQLAWRDFAYRTARATPALLERSLHSPGRRWSRDLGALAAWRGGETGEAAVDAAMRELAATGWISNRARMLVGSFLVRDLGIDWRHGARHFMRLLADGDPAVNALNWQWVAGTGYDRPAPFWRLAPERQMARHDPGGEWTRRWLGHA